MSSVRPVTVHDAEAIAHVHIASWRTTYIGIVPEEYLAALKKAERTLLRRKWLMLGVPVFVAEVQGEVVGFIGGSIREPLNGYGAELFAMYVLQHSQKCGVGTALLRVLAGSLHADSFRSMAAWCLQAMPLPASSRSQVQFP